MFRGQTAPSCCSGLRDWIRSRQRRRIDYPALSIHSRGIAVSAIVDSLPRNRSLDECRQEILIMPNGRAKLRQTLSRRPRRREKLTPGFYPDQPHCQTDVDRQIEEQPRFGVSLSELLGTRGHNLEPTARRGASSDRQIALRAELRLPVECTCLLEARCLSIFDTPFIALSGQR